MTDAPVILVTGARRGLGRSLTEHLLADGYRVVGCGRREIDWGAEGFQYLRADVTVPDEVDRLVAAAATAGSRLYGVVNCAGTASMNHALLTPASSVIDMIESSLVGSELVSRAAAEVMRVGRCGRIINLSSVAVPLRLHGQAGYVAAKGALEEMSQRLAAELAPDGITVNVIGATPIDTDMTRGVPRATMDRLIDRLPIRRLGLPRDVIQLLDFFLRPGCSMITGQVLYLGGVPND